MVTNLTEHGFTLEDVNVKFDFTCDSTPIQSMPLIEIYADGNIPVPQIVSGDRLLLPIDEGIAVNVDAEYESGEFDCDCFRGSFGGREGTLDMIVIERRGAFLLIALHNGIYASYEARRQNGMYGLEITTSKPCKVSYGIFAKLSDACRYYRALKNASHVTLTEKCRKNPNIEKLFGGAIFWIWNDHYDELMYSEKNVDISAAVGDDLLSIAENLYKSGISKALFGIFFETDSKYVEPLYKKYGYLSTQYDNYSDVLNPELLDIIPSNRVKACDYTKRRMIDYPDGVAVDANGKLCNAWALKGFDGKYHFQSFLCPIVAKQRMLEEIPQIINNYPYYKARFIDVFGGSLSDCHSKVHSLTREESVEVKKSAFSFLADIGLFAGTEDGFEAIVDSLVYSEGLHSPVYFRNHDSGRKHAHMYDSERAEHIKKHMMNPSCRVPLWHLVNHDCLVAFPYWGDSTASSPELLKRKILFACLYGCAPLYSFFVNDFESVKNDIVTSCKKIASVHEKVAMLPMTDFEVLSTDYLLQKTVFGNKYEVVANFSDERITYKGKTIEATDFIFGELSE